MIKIENLLLPKRHIIVRKMKFLKANITTLFEVAMIKMHQSCLGTAMENISILHCYFHPNIFASLDIKIIKIINWV